MTALTLNKITAQKGITIAEAASRVADLGWTPSYVQEAMTFPTDYKISKTLETKKKILGLNAARLYDIDIASQKSKIEAGGGYAHLMTAQAAE